MADTTHNTDTSAAFQEPAPTLEPGEPTQRRRSSLGKFVDAIKKPFHHEKEEVPPALQDVIHKMEERKEHVTHKMEREGKDASLLSGKRTDQVRNPFRG